jgi:Caspase domain
MLCRDGFHLNECMKASSHELHVLARWLMAIGPLTWLFATLTACAALPVQAEMRALLVGVSGYAERPLKGPRNDVRRMREVLEQRAFKPAQITTLADGVAGAGEPTRTSILTALDRLAVNSAAGDTVFLYFSGHGSQQPADRRTPQGRAEADGLHETFLPLDIGRWDGQAGTVHNALVDFELRDKVDRILARGAFVWAVFDACHSASLVRGLPGEDIRYRHVSPLDLGVPQTATDKASTPAPAESSGSRGLKGPPSFASLSADTGRAANAPEAVYFYAAQTTELTPEMRLPPGEQQREDQGLFGFVLRRALATGQPMSYRQLGQLMLAQYGALNLTGATPLFAGNALDRLVFGQQSLSVRQWPVSRERVTVPVGTLSGLSEGARFSVLPNAAADASQALGSLRAARVGLNHTELEPVAWADKPALNLNLLPTGAQARLSSSPERYSLRIAADERACRETCRWRAVLEALRTQGVAGTDLRWVGEGADLTLRFGERELLGLPPSEVGQADCGPRAQPCSNTPRGALLLSAADGDDPVRLARKLAERLHAVARANNLLRLAARVAVPDAPGIEASVSVQPAQVGALARRAATSEVVTRAEPGDKLIVNLHNRGNTPSDVTLLYIDARHGISALYPSRDGDLNRLEPGASLKIDDIELSDNDGLFGLERLLVIAVEAERQTERADFSFLAQSPLQAARARSGLMDDDVGAFFDAAFPGALSRGTPPREPSRRTRMLMFSVDLVPAKTARAR